MQGDEVLLQLAELRARTRQLQELAGAGDWLHLPGQMSARDDLLRQLLQSPQARHHRALGETLQQTLAAQQPLLEQLEAERERCRQGLLAVHQFGHAAKAYEQRSA